MIKIVLWVILLLSTIPGKGQTSLKAMDLQYGNYAVGFECELRYDSSRTYRRQMDWTNGYIPRPIPISVWYPSPPNRQGKKPLRVLDYMEILKVEEEWEHLPQEQILNWFYYANSPENQAHLQEVSQAFAGLEAAPGSFPVVLYAPSYQASSIENFALCEYLASHGYIVFSSPSRGTDTRWLDGGTTRDMETQARDIEFLLGQLHRYPYADREHIATMGFSFGGLSNVLAQIRNEQIDAVLSLDGTIKYAPQTLEKSPFYAMDKVDVPFIHMSQKDIPGQVLKEDGISPSLNTDFTFYDSLSRSQAYQLQFLDMTHAYFSTLGVLFQARDARQDKSDAKIMGSYRWVCRYSLQFLNAFLKGEEAAWQFMDNMPEENGVPRGLISHKSKSPQPQIARFEEFHDLARQQDYHNLLGLYNTFKAKEATFQIPEWKLNNLGLQLVFRPQASQQGIAVFLLATSLYPQSSNLYDSLAEGYLYLGEKEKAIESFKKALELNESNQNAKNRLKELDK